MKITLALVALLFIFPIAVNAQTLWHGSKYNMTLAQTKQAFPQATSPERIDKLGSGAVELLELRRVNIMHHTFMAKFFFKDKKLKQIMLSLHQKVTPYGAKLLFQRLSTALKYKYGNRIAHKVRHNMFGDDLLSTWVSGKTNITLLCNIVKDTPPLLNIVYQVRIAAQAGKL